MPENPPRHGVVALLGLLLALAVSALSADAPSARNALYLSYYGVGDGVIRQRVLDLIERTELNAVLIDVKGDRIYTIARVVAFKDAVLARHRPEWALTDVRTGRPWVDNERLVWLDPFREEAWDYVIAVAREAVSKGVPGDPVRLPPLSR